MGQFHITVNGRTLAITAEPDTPLLWVLRDQLGLKGAKYGCGVAECGACTVHLDGRAVRSCVESISAVAGKRIVTIEGLSSDAGHPLQIAWMAENVPQCGYCQAGQIMQAADLLAEHPLPTDEQINDAMAGNLCRCGTYERIRRAIHRAANETRKD